MKTGRIKDGYGNIQRDIMTDGRIDIYAKGVYCLLISYAGEKKSCYPSLKTICENLKISKPTAIKAIKELISIGFLIADKRKTSLGENECNIYYPMYIMDEGVVNDIDNPVKQIYQGSKGDLPRVVNDIDTKINNNKINKEDKDLFGFKGNEKKIFKIPSLEEIKQYFKASGHLDLAEKFNNHYTSNGWMVGKVKMKDWKSSANNWILDNKNSKPQKQAVPQSYISN